MVRPRAAAPGVQNVQDGSLFRSSVHNAIVTGQKTLVSKDTEGAGTHTGHTSAHADTQITQTNLTSNQTLQRHAPARLDATAETRNRGRLNSSKNSRRPGADHSPRPTQKRPPPANPTTCLHPQPVHACVCKTLSIRHAYRYLPVIYTKHAPKRRAHPARAAAIRRPRKLVFLEIVALRPSLTLLAFLVHLRGRTCRVARRASRIGKGDLYGLTAPSPLFAHESS